jgi:N-carbamoylputrescine amidase
MTAEPTFSVGLVQLACQANADSNREAAASGIRAAAARGAQIICLQELFASQYFCQIEDPSFFDLAETIPGPSTEHCAALARELDVVVIAPVFERRAPGLFHNSAVVIDAGGDILGVYRKMHIPDDPQFFEKFYFAPGDLGYQVFSSRFATIGVLICWDQWYPEAARLAALQGAEVILYPTAIGWLRDDRGPQGDIQHDAWRTIQRSHAIANGVYVAAVNRVGHEGGEAGGIEFWGRSFLCDPRGELMTVGSDSRDDVLVETCARDAIETQRRSWPFLRDRRIDSYAGLTHRFLDRRAGSATSPTRPGLPDAPEQ